jgi:hypothetical protein
MGFVKTIICLANSRKHSGRCIAGKEVLPDRIGDWVRPVSARVMGEVSEEERRYEDGRDPRVLDILEVPVIAHTPWLYQSENYVIDAAAFWTKTGEIQAADLARLVDRPDNLWGSGESAMNGLNDRVSFEEATKFGTPLALVRPDRLTLCVQTEGMRAGKPRRKVRARFSYRDTPYVLSVTDPIAERSFLAKPDGEYPAWVSYIVASLGEMHSDGYCYKLIATILSEAA